MKKYVNSYKIIAVFLLLIMFTTSVLPINNLTIAQAKGKIEISDKSLILNIGDTEILTVIGTKKKAVWTSSDAEVVSVNNKGIVLAKKVGNAEITAKIQNKAYTCKVIVLRPENPYIATAPFQAKGLDVGDINVVVPKDWKCDANLSGGSISTATITPITTMSTIFPGLYSNITVISAKTGVGAVDYSALKAKYLEAYTVDGIKKIYEKYAEEGETVSVSDLITGDYVSTLGTAFRFECNITIQKDIEVTKYKITYYLLNIENYYIGIQILDSGDSITPDFKTTAEYVLNSIQINE